MNSMGRKSGPPAQAQEKVQGEAQGKVQGKTEDGRRRASPRAEADDDEDGDIATPKRDRYGTDDEPL